MCSNGEMKGWDEMWAAGKSYVVEGGKVSGKWGVYVCSSNGSKYCRINDKLGDPP